MYTSLASSVKFLWMTFCDCKYNRFILIYLDLNGLSLGIQKKVPKIGV